MRWVRTIHGHPVYPGEPDLGHRPRVPVALAEEQRRLYEIEARHGNANHAVLGDPLPGRSVLDQRRRRGEDDVGAGELAGGDESDAGRARDAHRGA